MAKLIAIAFVLCAAAAPARAGDGNELTFGSFNRALHSASANAVTDTNLAGGALGYARDLRVHPIPKLDVWATGAFVWGSTEGTMFQTLATRIDMLGLGAGARARYRWRPRVVAGARLDIGMARTALKLDDGMGHTAGDTRWGGIATAAVSLDLLAIASRRFALGMRLEFGYVLAMAPALTATSDRGDDDTIRLPMKDASLGGLDLGGRFYGLSVLSQF